MTGEGIVSARRQRDGLVELVDQRWHWRGHSDPFEDACRALAHAHTHRDHAVPLLVAPQGMDHGGRADRSPRATARRPRMARER